MKTMIVHGVEYVHVKHRQKRTIYNDQTVQGPCAGCHLFVTPEDGSRSCAADRSAVPSHEWLKRHAIGSNLLGFDCSNGILLDVSKLAPDAVARMAAMRLTGEGED